MNGLISTVSGYFSKALILGALLPTVVFLAFFILLINPYLPGDLDSIQAIRVLGTEWKLVSVSFIAIVLSGLLHNLNTQHVRVYEGYPWRDTWAGKWMVARKVGKFRSLSAESKGMRTLLRLMKRTKDPQQKEAIVKQVQERLLLVPAAVRNAIGAARPTPIENWDKWYGTIVGSWGRLHRRIRRDYPAKEQLILPTRCGNVIRSFEHYPEHEYGLDAILMFPRLISQIDKEHRELIDDAKTSFDFMINCSTLAVVLGVCLTIIGLVTGAPFRSANAVIFWSIEITAVFAVAYLSYHGAINRAYIWGETVKAAFDLYRGKLLNQLGYAQAPNSKVEERKLWKEVSLQMLDGDSLAGPRIDYEDASRPATSVSSKAEVGDLQISRGLNPTGRENTYQVTITCLNSGSIAAESVVLTDTIPAGWNYRMKSAQLLDEAGSVTEAVLSRGINPIRFSIGDLEPGRSAILLYEILSLANFKNEVSR